MSRENLKGADLIYDNPEYSISDLCSIIPEYGSDTILINNFINYLDTTFDVATNIFNNNA